MTIELLKQKDENKWDDFVSRHPDATFYHQIGYKKVIEKTFGHQSYYLIAKEKNKISAVLPLFRIKSRLLPSCLVSLPFTGYGGVLAENEQAKNLLLEKAKEIYQKEKLAYLMLRKIIFQTAPERATLILNLVKNKEKMWQQMGGKTRNLIRKAEKFDLKIKTGLNELNVFYRLWSANRRDLGTPALPKKFFKNLAAQFPEKINYLVVYQKQKPLAGMLLVGFRETMEALYAGSIKKGRKYNANMFLYWQAILFAAQKGAEKFDFSPSPTKAPYFQFKKQFQGKMVAVEYETYGSQQFNPTQLKQNRKYDLLSAVWRKIPLPLANFLGPLIAKNIP